MGDVSIRRAEPRDLEELTGLLQELFRIEVDFTPDPDRQRQGLSLLLADRTDSCVVAAESAGRVVGMGTVQTLISTAEGGPVGLVEDVIVAASHRGRGVGRNAQCGSEQRKIDRALQDGGFCGQKSGGAAVVDGAIQDVTPRCGVIRPFEAPLLFRVVTASREPPRTSPFRLEPPPCREGPFRERRLGCPHLLLGRPMRVRGASHLKNRCTRMLFSRWQQKPQSQRSAIDASPSHVLALRRKRRYLAPFQIPRKLVSRRFPSARSQSTHGSTVPSTLTRE